VLPDFIFGSYFKGPLIAGSTSLISENKDMAFQKQSLTSQQTLQWQTLQ